MGGELQRLQQAKHRLGVMEEELDAAQLGGGAGRSWCALSSPPLSVLLLVLPLRLLSRHEEREALKVAPSPNVGKKIRRSVL